MGELDVLEQYLFAQDTVAETVLHLHRQAVKAALDRAEAAITKVTEWSSGAIADADRRALRAEAVVGALRFHNLTPTGRTRKCLPGCIACAALSAYEDADKVADG